MIVPPLFDAAVIGPMRHAPGRSALAVVAIALGVALGLAIQLINRSAADEVSRAARSLYGLADLAVEGDAAGFDEALYAAIARTPGVAAASPVVEVRAKLAGQRGALTVLGVDALRAGALQPAFAGGAGSISGLGVLDPAAVHLSSSAAHALGLVRGETLALQFGLQRVTLTIAGELPPAALEDRAAIVDIATAQWKLGMLGKLTRVNLRLAPDADAARVRDALASMLPPHVRITTPGEASDDALRLSRAYRSNLMALALVALFTGGYFVYSTQALAALRRRRELALLHALGVTRAQQLALSLSGAALIGTAGAAIGVCVGVVVAALGLRTLGGDLGAGYFRDAGTVLRLNPLELASFCALGVLVALAGTLRPALDAARIPTAAALKATDVASGQVHGHGAIAWGCVALAVLALAVPPIGGLPLQGYAAIALLLAGMVAATPAFVRWILRFAPGWRRVEYRIALAQLAGTARYATLSVSAIIVSFSLMVAMAIMVSSFRNSLDQWTQKLLPADVYVRAGYVGESAHFDAHVLQRIEALPGVARVERSRYAQVQLGMGRPPATLIARTVADPDRALWIMSSDARPAPHDAVPVWINEAAADLFALEPGDLLELPIAGRELRASVRGVWRDYEHQNGAVVMDLETYARLSGDRAVNTIWLWLDDPGEVARVQGALRDALPAGAEYDVRTPGELRRASLAAFDRAFAVTYLLELVAVMIGLFGIAAGISAQVLARRGEFGALRHLGFTRAQIAAMLAIEGAVLGAVGVLVGLLTGAIVAVVLIYVVNRQSFHWSMDWYAPYGLLAGLSAALIGAAASIAILSGRQAMGAEVVRAVKEDW